VTVAMLAVALRQIEQVVVFMPVFIDSERQMSRFALQCAESRIGNRNDNEHRDEQRQRRQPMCERRTVHTCNHNMRLDTSQR